MLRRLVVIGAVLACTTANLALGWTSQASATTDTAGLDFGLCVGNTATSPYYLGGSNSGLCSSGTPMEVYSSANDPSEPHPPPAPPSVAGGTALAVYVHTNDATKGGGGVALPFTASVTGPGGYSFSGSYGSSNSEDNIAVFPIPNPTAVGTYDITVNTQQTSYGLGVPNTVGPSTGSGAFSVAAPSPPPTTTFPTRSTPTSTNPSPKRALPSEARIEASKIVGAPINASTVVGATIKPLIGSQVSKGAVIRVPISSTCLQQTVDNKLTPACKAQLSALTAGQTASQLTQAEVTAQRELAYCTNGAELADYLRFHVACQPIAVNTELQGLTAAQQLAITQWEGSPAGAAQIASEERAQALLNQLQGLISGVSNLVGEITTTFAAQAATLSGS
jgi:hypothetical protein